MSRHAAARSPWPAVLLLAGVVGGAMMLLSLGAALRPADAARPDRTVTVTTTVSYLIIRTATPGRNGF